MAYVLNAVLASDALLAVHPRWAVGSRVVPLEQGVSMVPITDELYDGFERSETDATVGGPMHFTILHDHLAAEMGELSKKGTVAYVEAEYFGGHGEQRCVVWKNGAIVFGPVEQSGAINHALRLLGVRRRPFIDEFSSVGLDRHRTNEDWVMNGD